MSISIAIAVHNEEKNIIRCLESVYDWVDEIIIVDGESTDKTVKLIKKQDTRNKIQVIHASNPPMFHINKQKALEACTGDWILQLDADEVVSAELKQEIIQVINPKQYQNLNDQNSLKINNLKFNENLKLKIENLQTAVAYNIPRLNYFLGKPLRKGGQYPDYTIRLYRNDVAQFPCKDVHENVIISSKFFQPPRLDMINNDRTSEVNLEIGHFKAPLLHYPYPTFQEYLSKWNRYNKLEAERMKQKGIKPSLKLFIDYIFIKPPIWFFKTYFRHKGFIDGIPGFVFSLFSALRYWRIYYYLNLIK